MTPEEERIEEAAQYYTAKYYGVQRVSPNITEAFIGGAKSDASKEYWEKE